MNHKSHSASVLKRRHKEASLADVTSVGKGGPRRMRNMEGNISSCLTVNFQKGGGIDLRFTTDAERDLWFKVFKDCVLFLVSKFENGLIGDVTGEQ